MNTTNCIVVTGVAGFIGFHTARKFLNRGYTVIGIDNVSSYYDVRLKHDRLRILSKNDSFHFYKIDITDLCALEEVLDKHLSKCIVHLAAQAGVRHSLKDPFVYGTTNLNGFLNILEIAKRRNIPIVYASSSSVYGGIDRYPYNESMHVNKPVSLYAATKAANELMAYSYSEMFNVRSVGLRFFTVYGPWGRPDMAAFIFLKALYERQPITLYREGTMWRDFTYIDDIVSGIEKSVSFVMRMKKGAEVFNLGNNEPVLIRDFLKQLEHLTGIEAQVRNAPMQKGDIVKTAADVSKAQWKLAWRPTTDYKTGLKKLVQWYNDYYKVGE